MNTISQLNTADEGYASSGITGMLAPIYEHKTFNKGGKEGSIQTAILKDTNGSSIRLKFWNMAEIKDEGGLTILPTDNGKGPKGLTIKNNEWQGKVTKELHVGDQARISWGESGEVIADEVMSQPNGDNRNGNGNTDGDNHGDSHHHRGHWRGTLTCIGYPKHERHGYLYPRGYVFTGQVSEYDG